MNYILKILSTSFLIFILFNISVSNAFNVDDLGNINEKEKNNILKQINNKTEKIKLEKKVLVDSLKKDTNNYKLIIKNTDKNISVKKIINFFDKGVKVTHVNGDTFILEIPVSGNVGKNLLSSTKNGVIPKKLLGFEVEAPFEVSIDSSSSYLLGEDLSNLWGISKMGAYLYQEGLSTKSKIKVGIIDTGIDYTHPDLVGNIYTNLGEVAGNGIDDDNNGYVDDIHGYDFVNNDNDPMDDHYHGTHVSGTIGASVNGNGVFGVNSNASLVGLKVLSAGGSGSSYDIGDAIRYAADNGIKVVNMSLGGRGNTSSYMCSSIDYALSKGTFSVVAAGNDDQNTSRFVPAGCPNAITVSAVDESLTKAYFSNYGDEVDVAAAGVNVLSTIPGGYEYLNGTSMATPHITGLVSTMLTYSSGLSLSDIKNIFKNPSLTEQATTSSRKYIGRFANMGKIMNYLGVADDDGSSGSGGTTNQAPILDVNIVENFTNDFTITANASDSDGSISKYEFIVNGVNQNSSDLNNAFDIIISEDTNVNVIVTDNEGATTSQLVNLTYTDPNSPENIAPTVSLSVKVKGTKHIVKANASDVDGSIVSYDFFIYTGGILYDSFSQTSNSFSVNISKSYSQEVRVDVVVHDDSGATANDSLIIYTP